MMERLRGPRPERRVDEPRGRRADDHRTVGRFEAAGRWILQPLVVKLALISIGVAGGWLASLWALPEGHAQLARTVNELDTRTAQNDSTSLADRALLHQQMTAAIRRVDSLQSSADDLKTGVCLQTPLDYRPLMKCDPNLPPPRRIQ